MPSLFDGELTSAAMCWRVERSDGAGLAVTSHDAALSHDGIAFAPAPGMTPAAVSRGLGLDAGSGEIAGAVHSEALDAGDLAFGRWTGSAVALSAVDWADANAPAVELLAGQLGEVAIRGDEFTAELQGASSRLDAPVCPSTSPECRAQFGDKKCRVDLAGRTLRARVSGRSGSELQLDQAIGGEFLFGRLRYLSGANCGLSSTIVGVSGSVVRVRDLPRGEVASGCSVELREGCDKRFATCVERFANAANFRGEPHLPGNDLLTRYPGA